MSSSLNIRNPLYVSGQLFSSLGGTNCHQARNPEDTLRVILAELDGVPNLDNEELKDARETAITLELTNRFASVDGPFQTLTCHS
jgi:Ras GTPase-activating-like protein IQGAP2/3